MHVDGHAMLQGGSRTQTKFYFGAAPTEAKKARSYRGARRFRGACFASGELNRSNRLISGENKSRRILVYQLLLKNSELCVVIFCHRVMLGSMEC